MRLRASPGRTKEGLIARRSLRHRPSSFQRRPIRAWFTINGMFTIVAAGAVAACVAALLFSRATRPAEQYVYPVRRALPKADEVEKDTSGPTRISDATAPAGAAEGAMLAESVAASAGEQITALRRAAANLRRLAQGAGAGLEREVRSLNLH